MEENKYKLLGLYAKYNSDITLDSFNSFLDTLGFHKLSESELDEMLLNISHEGKPLTLYLLFKSGEGNPIECFLTKNIFENYSISKENQVHLIKVVQANSELKNGNFTLKQFKKTLKTLDIVPTEVMTNSFLQELIDYVLTISMKLASLDSYVNDSEIQNRYVLDNSMDLITNLNMKQRELQNLSRKYNKLKRSVLDQQLLREQVLNKLSEVKIKTPTPIKKVNSSSAETVLIVCLSDLHIGLNTPTFDNSILLSRLNIYLSHIKEYVEQHTVSHIYIINLGDSIENVYMHLNQMSSVDMTLSEQVAYSVSTIIDFIQKIRALEVPVTYTGIMGNHDRLNPNIKQNIVGDGVSTIINTFVEARAKELDIDYLEPFAEIRGVLKVNGINIAYVHGDYDKVAKKDIISKLSEYFDSKIDIVLSGHYHNLLIQTLGSKQYILQSGAFFTGNPYSDSLGVTADASQIMLGINKNKEIDIQPIIF